MEAIGQAHTNSITSVILSLSLSDKGLLALTMSVSACHLIRRISTIGSDDHNSKCHDSLIGSTDYKALQRAQWKYLTQGIQEHSQRIRDLASGRRRTTNDLIVALAGALLMCQLSTCDGGVDGLWRVHLDAAQALGRDLRVEATPFTDGYTVRVIMDWLLYHIAICRLTARDRHLLFIDGDAVVGKVLLVGPQDGLAIIINRIFNLKMVAKAEGRDLCITTATAIHLSPQLITDALAISADLEAWQYRYSTFQQGVVGECYRWAAFILLYSIVYDCTLTHERIQYALQGGLECLDELSETDSAQTCALFPMFVFGISAVKQVDQERVRKKLDAHQRWSGLGNVAEARRFLELWWEQCEMNGSQIEWWMWQSVALNHGIDPVLV